MTHRTRGLAAVALALGLMAGLSVPVRSDDPVTSAVRFNREIVRIFDRKCLPCHVNGGLAMPLATYRDVRPWSRAIREEIVEQRMPPWSAARGYGRFTGDIGLTPRELATILTWTDGGVPRGDDSDLPAPPAPAAAAPADLRIDLPEQAIPAGDGPIVRSFTIDSGLTADRRVQRVQWQPGNRRVSSAAFVSVAGAGATWIGAWTPWQTTFAPGSVGNTGGDAGAFLLRAKSQLRIDVHYRSRESAERDRSSLDLLFAPADHDPSANIVTSLTIEARRSVTGAPPRRLRGETTLTREVELWALRPDLADGQSLEVSARAADGTITVLLWIPKHRAEWPTPYVLAEPIRLPAGTTIVATTAGGGATPAPARVVLALLSASPSPTAE